MRVAAKITLSDSDKKILEKNTKSRAVSIRLSEPSKIVLLSAESLENKVIAQRLTIPPNKVGKWRNRFAEGGIKSIGKDKPRGAMAGKEHRVAKIRRKHAIAGQRRSTPDPEILTMHAAAQYCGVSERMIKRLVASGVLKKNQVVRWAPWEVARADLDAEPVQGILAHLRKTGRFPL